MGRGTRASQVQGAAIANEQIRDTLRHRSGAHTDEAARWAATPDADLTDQERAAERQMAERLRDRLSVAPQAGDQVSVNRDAVMRELATVIRATTNDDDRHALQRVLRQQQIATGPATAVVVEAGSRTAVYGDQRRVQVLQDESLVTVEIAAGETRLQMTVTAADLPLGRAQNPERLRALGRG